MRWDGTVFLGFNKGPLKKLVTGKSIKFLGWTGKAEFRGGIYHIQPIANFESERKIHPSIFRCGPTPPTIYTIDLEFFPYPEGHVYDEIRFPAVIH